MTYSKHGRELVFLVVAHDNGPKRNPRFETFAFDRRNKVRAVGYGSSLEESIADLAADWPAKNRKKIRK